GAREVARPDAGGEAVARRVREGDRLRLVIERRDRHDGAENLLLQHAAVAAEAGDHRRLDEPALAIDAPAARGDGAAFLLRQLDVAEDLLEVRGGDQRADVFADAQLLGE